MTSPHTLAQGRGFFSHVGKALSPLLCLWLLVVPTSVWAADHLYNMPLKDCDYGTYRKCVVTAYYDLNKGSGSSKDWNCGTKSYSGHKGTDFGVAGTINVRPVVAAADGVVSVTNDGCKDNNTATGDKCGGGYGNYVKLTHSDTGHSTYYAHMAKGSVVVTKGQKVTCGTLLGKAASSGNSTGPHLHFEVRYNSDAVRDDPFNGSCGGPTTFWKKQNGYRELPADDQCAPVEIDDAAFASETIPDDSHFTVGAAFTKTWTIKNTGNTTWTKAKGYKFVSIGGTQMSSITSVELGDSEAIAPGTSKTWSVPMTAPATPGTYTHNWSMSRSGKNFGGAIFTRIIADAPPSVNAAQLTSETPTNGVKMESGENFTKTWTVKNTGNTTWKKADGYKLVHVGGSPLNATSPVELSDSEAIAPGASKTWSLKMKAPISAQTHKGTWKMEKSGTTFGDELKVSIVVEEPPPPPPPPPPEMDAGTVPIIEDAGTTPTFPEDSGTIPVLEDAGHNTPAVDASEPLPPITDAASSNDEDAPPFEGENGGATDWQSLIDPETGFVSLESGCSSSSGPFSLPFSLGLLGLWAACRRRRRQS